jgi:hypothetical protein
MKKLIKFTLVLLLATFIISCSTDEQFIKTSNERTGIQTNNPDLVITEQEYDWAFRPNGFGIRIPFYNDGTYRVEYKAKTFGGTEMDTVFTYSCPIANIAQQMADGSTDFVVNKEEDGFVNGSGGYNFEGMLSITTFQNGLPVGEVIKQTFDVTPTHTKLDFNYLLENYYEEPFMAIPARTADMYTNRAVVRSGKQVVVIEVNPNLLINESNYENNISTLPINVTITGTDNNFLGTAVLDLSALAENQTIPPSDLRAPRSRNKGKTYVALDWNCPYHAHRPTPESEPIYVKHYFTVKRNGVAIATNLEHSEFTDVINGNPQTINYTITTTTGLGESVQASIIVTR